MASDSWIKKVSFILAIIILFVSVVQVGLSTFWPDPEYPNNDCYTKVAPDQNPDSDCLAQAEADRLANDEQRATQHNMKFIVGTLISLITVLLVLFLNFEENIVYGLFGGGVISQLFNLRFVENKNIIGFIALLVLFVIVIFFVQRKSKK